jgi:hypothetical protein
VLWLILVFALWNALFEMMVVRGVREYLLRAALFDAGRGPMTPIREVMDPAISHATWVATAWSAVVLLAALVTVLMVRAPAPQDT